MKNLLAASLIASFALVTTACVRAQDDARSPSESPQPLKVQWTLSDDIKAPESIYYDASSGFLFLSQIGEGGGKTKDGDGRISKLSLDGKMIAANWATGLNSPKGIRSHGGTLWVSDIDRLVAFDIASGKQTREVAIESAQFLNDVATGPDGAVYVSDLAASKIYRYHKGKTSVFAEGSKLEHPNGVLVDGDSLIIGGWGADLQSDFSTKVDGRLQRIDLKSGTLTPITKKPTGHLDGIEVDGRGGYLVSDWIAGKVLRVGKDGNVTVIHSTVKGAADIAYIVEKNLFILPEMMENKVTAFHLPAKVQAAKK